MGVHGEGFEHLGRVPSLQRIYLGGVKSIPEGGLKPIARLGQLRLLDLTETNVRNADLEPLTALPTLGWLHLGETRIDDAAVEHLARMTGLRELTVSGTKVSADGLDRLEKALPNTQIHQGTIRKRKK
jgi:hypothetical protein